MKTIDLHNHSTASDGTLTPAECVAYAAEKGLSAIAITDHDTAVGAAEALPLSGQQGVEVIPGIEISTDYNGYGIHILGYFIDPASPALDQMLEYVIAERKRRNREIFALMEADGLDITAAGMLKRFPDSVVGRPHLAQMLVEMGLVSSVSEAFDRYLSKGRRYYRARRYLPLETAFEVIRNAGGKAVFAHPFQYGFDEEGLLALTRTLVDYGCKGIECLYSGYTPEQSEYLCSIAEHFGLCVTGGSDFHGSRKPHIDMGGVTVPYELLERLREA